jgi:hypothetical protein
MPESCNVPAVCVPPGATLLLMDIPLDLQERFGIGRVEEVTFTQISANANAYRDSVRFRNGKDLLLQSLREGQRVRVLSLGDATVERSVPAGSYMSM